MGYIKEFKDIDEMVDYPDSYKALIFKCLDVDTIDRVGVGYDIFADLSESEREELYGLPSGFEKVLEFKEVYSPDLAIGYVVLGTYKGKKVIMEQPLYGLLSQMIGRSNGRTCSPWNNARRSDSNL